MVGSRPAQPTIAAITHSASPVAASTSASAPGRGPAAAAVEQRSKLGQAAPRRRRPRAWRRSPARPSASSRTFDWAVSATTSNRSGERCDQVERRLADRAGRAEDGDPALHARPPSARSAVSTATGSKSVEAVEHAAVAGQQIARILDPGAALHPAFEQVAGLRRDREQAAPAPDKRGLRPAI